MDARIVELWLRLTADALHGADDAQRALEALGSTPMSADSLSAWMKLWLPEARSASGRITAAEVSEFETLVETWWRLLGVVPRFQYDKLKQRHAELERQHTELQRRFEQTEGTIRRLRGTLSSTGHEADAQAMLDSWERLTQETLEAQAEWTRRWLEGWDDEESAENR